MSRSTPAGRLLGGYRNLLRNSAIDILKENQVLSVAEAVDFIASPEYVAALRSSFASSVRSLTLPYLLGFRRSILLHISDTNSKLL